MGLGATLLVCGFVFVRCLLHGYVDEVLDEGDALRVRNKGLELLVPIGGIINVNFNRMQSPQRIAPRLRTPGPCGEEISFMPRMRLFCCFTHPTAEDLIRRAEVARRSP